MPNLATSAPQESTPRGVARTARVVLMAASRTCQGLQLAGLQMKGPTRTKEDKRSNCPVFQERRMLRNVHPCVRNALRESSPTRPEPRSASRLGMATSSTIPARHRSCRALLVRSTLTPVLPGVRDAFRESSPTRPEPRKASRLGMATSRATPARHRSWPTVDSSAEIGLEHRWRQRHDQPRRFAHAGLGVHAVPPSPLAVG